MQQPADGAPLPAQRGQHRAKHNERRAQQAEGAGLLLHANGPPKDIAREGLKIEEHGDQKGPQALCGREGS